MGRSDTGAMTTSQCLRLNVSQFTEGIRKGILGIPGSISWASGANIGVLIKEVQGNYLVDLIYDKTEGGEKIKIKYAVWIIGKSSNLGKGTVYYFLCPFTHKPCRFLYMGDGSRYFRSRQAYQHRIYYASQLSWHNDSRWRLERQLERLYVKHPRSHYKGKSTRAQQRFKRLEKVQQYHDGMRWIVWSKALLKSIAKNGGN